ncbi:MAG: hypothetical protein DMG61_19460 [Acidobacteria bacterium]|nr:MAG: hypothetical protein DMG61_19460 [Acidobacteriota bacterium]
MRRRLTAKASKRSSRSSTAPLLSRTATRSVFNFSSSPDLHDASMVVADLDQGGISMPDRDYYIKDDEKTKTVRQAYLTYLKKSFVLAGQSEAQAADSAQTVLNVETDLAKASMDRTVRRDPAVHDHKMSLNDAAALAPNLQLVKFFKFAGVPSFTSLNVENPEFFKQANGIFMKYPVDAWKTYLNWQMINFAAPWLSDPFVQARSPDRRNSKRAGNAASIRPTTHLAKRSDSRTSIKPSASKASSAC